MSLKQELKGDAKDALENIFLGFIFIVFACAVLGLIAGVALAFITGHYVIGTLLAIPIVLYFAHAIGSSM